MIGKILGGRYEIKEKVDSGGMAYVYRAVCKKTNQTVAVKILKEKFAGNTEYIERFKREAQAAFSLENEHIVHVKDIGYDENVYYMVMEFVDGPTLKSIIEADGPLDEKRCIEYAIQICSALSAAHKNGIIHRDIKPHNVLVDMKDVLKVTDFGIAKSLTSTIKKSGQVMGSVYYVSPEQARGEELDQRSDIYSLGIVMFEMLTGQMPYTGEKSISVALKHINEQLTPPAELNEDVSESMNRIVLKAASKEKDARYKNVEELKSDLILALVDKSGDFVDIEEKRKALLMQINIKKNNIWKVAVVSASLIIFIVAGVLGGKAIFSNLQPVQTEQVLLAVPSLVGMELEEAERILEELGYNAIVSYESNDEFEAETVLEQSPEAGSEMLTEENIMLTVSSGPQILYMPNLVGMTETEAEDTIAGMGLILGEKTFETDETVLAGTVLSQEPAAETDVLEGATVNMVISAEAAKDTGTVPNVVDNTLAQAAGRLVEAGFVNIYVYQEESDREPGTVISQSPGQGVQAQYDNDIDLHISMYTELEYTALLSEELNITEVGSKVKIVYEDIIEENTVYFKVREMILEPGEVPLSIEMSALTGGVKKVKVFINQILEYEYDIYFYERSEDGEG